MPIASGGPHIVEGDPGPASITTVAQESIKVDVSLAPQFIRYTMNCISHVTLRHMLTHIGCVYNRSL